MISRVADSCFWLGRYLERAESTARVLPATRHLSLDRELDEAQCWFPVVVVSGEEARFVARHGEHGAGDGELVQRHMTWDLENPTSIARSLAAVRENARSIREVLSSEVWWAVNELHLWLGSDEAKHLWEADRDGFYRKIRASTALVLGTLHGTMLHDEPLELTWLGVLLERASQTARILDVHTHTMRSRHAHEARTSSEIEARVREDRMIDTAIWIALLRACSGFEPFVQRHQGRVSSAAIARFLVHEPAHPRSVRYGVHGALSRLARIRDPGNADLPGRRAWERLRALDAWLGALGDDALEGERMHEVLTRCVDEIAAIGDAIGQELLGYAPVAGEQAQ